MEAVSSVRPCTSLQENLDFVKDDVVTLADTWAHLRENDKTVITTPRVPLPERLGVTTPVWRDQVRDEDTAAAGLNELASLLAGRTRLACLCALEREVSIMVALLNPLPSPHNQMHWPDFAWYP
jgi:hypothetical protein